MREIPAFRYFWPGHQSDFDRNTQHRASLRRTALTASTKAASIGTQHQPFWRWPGADCVGRPSLGRPVQLEITQQTRRATGEWVAALGAARRGAARRPAAGYGSAPGPRSRLGARSARHRLMPAVQIGERRRDRDVRHVAGDVDRNQGGDVSDRVPVAGDELPPGQLLLHPLQPLLHDGALRLAVYGELPQPFLEHRVGVADGLADRPEQLELHAPVPHLDLGLLAWVAAHQIGFGVLPFEIAADRHRFGDAAAVVEL